MEEILHHLSIMGYLPYQLVQDFVHQQYVETSKILFGIFIVFGEHDETITCPVLGGK